MSLCRGSSSRVLATSIKSSKEKIEELKQYGMKIIFYDYPEGYYDEVGGYHDCAEGWNPNGVWCGECTKESCADCPSRYNKEGLKQ